MECGTPEALEAAALLLARALKGSLPVAGAAQREAAVGPLLVGARGAGAGAMLRLPRGQGRKPRADCAMH